MKQTEANPWDAGRREVPAGHRRQGHGPQPHQLRRLHRDRGRHRRPAARHRHVLDQEDRPPHRGAQEGRQGQVPSSSPSTRRRKRIALGLKQLERRPVGRPTSPAATSPGRSSRARSPSSPTSASSSSSRTTSKACSTSSEIADQKIDKPEAVLHERTSSRSRYSASTPTSGRSA